MAHGHEFDIQFIIEPHIRFPGRAGEQKTMFFRDPSGNNLEFKVIIAACQDVLWYAFVCVWECLRTCIHTQPKVSERWCWKCPRYLCAVMPMFTSQAMRNPAYLFQKQWCMSLLCVQQRVAGHVLAVNGACKHNLSVQRRVVNGFYKINAVL